MKPNLNVLSLFNICSDVFSARSGFLQLTLGAFLALQGFGSRVPPQASYKCEYNCSLNSEYLLVLGTYPWDVGIVDVMRC